MQEDSNEVRRGHRNQRDQFSDDHFNYRKNYIERWDDFKETWKPIKFTQELNSFTDQQIKQFWHTQLKNLSNQTQKICILVPNQVNKTETIIQDMPQQQKRQLQQKQQESNKKAQKMEKEKNQEVKTIEPKKQTSKVAQGGKKKTQKNNKTTKIPKVRLTKLLVQICMQLVQTQYKNLGYSFEPLFLGNQKQLLIYRQCNAIQQYLQRYRLPNNFKESTQQLENLSGQLYQLKIQRNKAISNFSKSSKTLELYEKYDKILNLFETKFKQFGSQFSKILNDFNERKSCREIILKNFREQFKQKLQQFCKTFDVEVINKYDFTQHDEFKDLKIVKTDDYRLFKQQRQEPPQPKMQYVYIDPPKIKKVPKEINSIQFKSINIQKQCYLYQINLPQFSQYNQILGIFIRSDMEQYIVYQLNVNVDSKQKEIVVQIYPYRYGKSVYQFFTWNQIGFSKHHQKVVLFNQLKVPGTDHQPVKNSILKFIGKSQNGLLADVKSTEGKILDFHYNNLDYLARDFSFSNGAIICDCYGSVAGWGQMLYLTQNDNYEIIQEKLDTKLSVLQQINQKMNIEKPCLLLQRQSIRKVSAGRGYFLMLSTFGCIWSMGVNIQGQLGLGNFRTNIQCNDPRLIYQSSDKTNKPFIVDIKATNCGASFALDDKGNLYRWGVNQVQVTKQPVFDRFGSIVNFSTNNANYKESQPIKIKKNHIKGKVVQIEAGMRYFYALTDDNLLYGWGECVYLGIQPLKNTADQVIQSIVWPIQIHKNIVKVFSGWEHTIVIATNKTILGWGNSNYFLNQPPAQPFVAKPIDITEKYCSFDQIKQIRCGQNYTVVLTKSNKILIYGQYQGFGARQFESEQEIKQIACSYQSCIGILVQK